MRNVKKVMTAVLTAAMIVTSAPVLTPSISYAAGATDYTSAPDIELNKMYMVTANGNEDYLWYKINVGLEAKVKITLTKLEGEGGINFALYNSVLKELDKGTSNSSRVFNGMGEDTTYYLRLVGWNKSANLTASLILEADETVQPTVEPTTASTVVPVAEPTVEPTITSTIEPTVEPTVEPTIAPTIEPTVAPASDSDIGSV